MQERFIGNEQNLFYFNNALKNSALSHAYLFYGPEGVGKKQFAGIVARTVGTGKKSISPVLVGDRFFQNPDVLLAGVGMPTISIAQIRHVRQFVARSPVFLQGTYVIIDNAHTMGHEAANALLKVLEEPGSKTIFFLVTNQREKVIQTITSRCQGLYFRPIPEPVLFRHLFMKYPEDKYKIKNISRLCNGSLGVARSLLAHYGEQLRNFSEAFNNLDTPLLIDRFDMFRDLVDRKRQVGSTLLFLGLWKRSLMRRQLKPQLQQHASFLKELLKTDMLLQKAQYNKRLLAEQLALSSYES